MHCPRCGLGQPSDHRFCLSCGARLPTELLPPRRPKVTRWFRSIPVHAEDRPGSMLRVSRYLDEFDIETEDGDRKSTRLHSSHVKSSYAVFCLKKKLTTLRQRARCNHTDYKHRLDETTHDS